MDTKYYRTGKTSERSEINNFVSAVIQSLIDDGYLEPVDDNLHIQRQKDIEWLHSLQRGKDKEDKNVSVGEFAKWLDSERNKRDNGLWADMSIWGKENAVELMLEKYLSQLIQSDKREVKLMELTDLEKQILEIIVCGIELNTQMQYVEFERIAKEVAAMCEEREKKLQEESDYWKSRLEDLENLYGQQGREGEIN